MLLGLSSSTTTTATGSDGSFWKDILDKDALPSYQQQQQHQAYYAQDGSLSSTARSIVQSNLEPLKQKVMVLALQAWQWLRPDVAGTGSGSTYRDLRYYRLLLLSAGGVAIFFWCWAILNTIYMKDGQDLGIYSFASVVLSSLVGLIKAKPNNKQGSSSGAAGLLSSSFFSFDKKICIFVTATHVLVALNYFLGVIFSFSVGTVIYWRFGSYCVIFCILWGYAAHQGWKLGESSIDLVDSSSFLFVRGCKHLVVLLLLLLLLLEL